VLTLLKIPTILLIGRMNDDQRVRLQLDFAMVLGYLQPAKRERALGDKETK
jgi:hypothetical protein